MTSVTEPELRKQDGARPDLALFERMRGGDEGALAELYDRHHVAVYWTAFAVLRLRHDSEEIVTDTFMTFWTKRAQIEPLGDSVLPWLVTTSRYLALNRYRAEQRRRTDELHDDRAGDAVDPEAAAMAGEIMGTIRAMMHRMPQVDQRIFELCLLEDLTYKEAAYRLGITHATVRNRLSRIKNTLRVELTLLRKGR